MNGLSANQQLFLDEVLIGKNVFLTGKAGTGKSFVVKKAIRLLKDKGKKIVALAPTGIAANNIEGQTIHSLFGLQPFGVLEWDTCNFLKGEKRKLLNALDVIFIDEVSMLRPDMLDAMNWTLLKNGCRPLSLIQLIFVGDLKQLPAPIDDNMRSVMYKTYNSDEFYNAKVYESINPITIELDVVQRQTNEEFIHHLNIVREGGKSEYFKQFLSKDYHGIILAPHNATVAKYNQQGLDLIQEEEHRFDAVISGNAKADEFNFEPIIKVKHGCKIMYLVNSKNNNLVNGTLGIFVVRGEQFFIDVNGVEYALEPITVTKHNYVLNEQLNSLELIEIGSIMQYPIKLAYALTIHKSQGLTFDEVTIDLSLPCFSKGQLYTALSRVRTPEGLKIIVNRH
jgi:ATP-dependent DNA helicase PIF1